MFETYQHAYAIVIHWYVYTSRDLYARARDIKRIGI
jgi:hypothetical protein